METTTNKKRSVRVFLTVLFTAVALFSVSPVFAHCDSYDGPTVKDALKALETNNVNLVLKWIDKEQEPEIMALFQKTYRLRKGDQEVYKIVEKHFLETLVRLHRETEGFAFTGLKPAGSASPIVMLSDRALESGEIDGLLKTFNQHVEKVMKEKYNKVAELSKVKNESPEKGRAYVEAYVDYIHTLEGMHDILTRDPDAHSGKTHEASTSCH